MVSLSRQEAGNVGGVDTRNDIREFLTSRRAKITPEQAGLPTYWNPLAGSARPAHQLGDDTRGRSSTRTETDPDKEDGVQPQPRKPTVKGPAEWFTGDVWIDPIVQPEGGSQLSVGAVHFTPGARTAWHSHNGGQTLYVTEGGGLIQSRHE